MYLIEMHGKHNATTVIVLEKGDHSKDIHKLPFRTVLNHTGDNDERYCTFCAQQRLMRKEKS